MCLHACFLIKDTQKPRFMLKQVILSLILLSGCVAAGAQTTSDKADNVKYDLSKGSVQLPNGGISVNLAFELTTPSGSAGRWTTGGGAYLSAVYYHYLKSQWFIASGVAGYYTSLGTDFIPGSTTYSDASIKNWGLRIPLQAGLTIPLQPDLDLTLSTGPQLNINLVANEELPPDFSQPVPVPGESISLFGKGFRRVEAQWSFWGGFTFMEHYSVGISAAIGLSPEAVMMYGPRKLLINRNNVAIVLSYKF